MTFQSPHISQRSQMEKRKYRNSLQASETVLERESLVVGVRGLGRGNVVLHPGLSYHQVTGQVCFS